MPFRFSTWRNFSLNFGKLTETRQLSLVATLTHTSKRNKSHKALLSSLKKQNRSPPTRKEQPFKSRSTRKTLSRRFLLTRSSQIKLSSKVAYISWMVMSLIQIKRWTMNEMPVKKKRIRTKTGSSLKLRCCCLVTAILLISL